MTPILVVIDTNVCLDLFVFNDTRWLHLLEGLKNGNIEAVTRADCHSEWLAVLEYPHLPIKIETKKNIIDMFDTLITIVAPPEKSIILPRCSDKDDQKFLEIARDTNAKALITKDKALLKLARKIQLSASYSILTPEKFISTLVPN
ncbi:putative toxin-antitoxin system toxin component, PIN family [Undibacterium sp.]|uniref:putative toxin-antitoxin system toxin component, PIN family n=1 Tax=Undibacterium sp. TaxID=1914977 RepID=UPI0025EC4856|nr:putative toxin-antitoxin system toxin component, PIN family [Undibacterium sp.]